MDKFLPVFLLYLFTANFLFGKDGSPTDSVTIDEITVSAFRYEKRLLDTPGAISIITTSQLNEHAGKPIDQLVNQLPGVYMQSGTLNTNRLTIRGIGSRSPFSTNKIRAYLEGIPLTNGVGETTIEDLNLQMLSKIEVIKGPSSGYYGSGLAGTLLFKVKQAQKDVAHFSGGLSSYNTQTQNVSVYLQNENFNHSLHYENLSSDGYRENNQTERANLSYFGQLTTEKHQFNLIINHTDVKAFIPSSVDLETFQKTPEKAAANWAAAKGFEDYQKNMAGLSINSQWKHNWTSQLSLFGRQFKNYELRPFNILQEESSYWGERFITEKKIETDDAEWKFLLGNESFFEKYNWATFEDKDAINDSLLSDNLENRRYINAFLQLNLIVKNKLALLLGANLNTTNYTYTDRFLDDGNQSGKHRFKTIFSPRLAISYPLTKNQRVYTNISHGFSPPSLEETLLPDGQRNSGIQPETGWNYELGSRGTLFPGLYYDISAYFMKISNLLVAKRVEENAYLGVNAGKTAHPGFEYFLQYELFRTTKVTSKINHNGSFSPYYFVDFIDDDNDYSGNELTGTPRFSNSSSLEVNFNKGLVFSIHHQFTGSMPLRDDNTIFSDAYSIFNMKSSYQKKWERLGMKISGGIYNLLNEKYASMVAINAASFAGNQPRYYYPGMPLNFSFNLSLSYQL